MRLRGWEMILLGLAALSLLIWLAARTVGAAATSQAGAVSRIARPGVAFWGEPVDVELRINAGALPICAAPAAAAALYATLVIDHSSSMAGSPLVEARKAAEEFVNLMELGDPGDAISVVMFDDAAHEIVSFSRDRVAVVQAIQSITEGGGTNIAAALTSVNQQGGSQPGAAVRHVIVLLSDGQSDAGSAINIANQLKSQGARIVSIALGDADRATLEQIASSPQDFYQTTDPAALMEIYTGIAEGIVGTAATNVSLAERVNTRDFHLLGGLNQPQQNNDLISWRLPFVGQHGRSLGYLLSPVSLGLHTISQDAGQVQLTDCNGQVLTQATAIGPQVLVLFPLWLLYLLPALSLVWGISRLVAWWRGRRIRPQPIAPPPRVRVPPPPSGREPPPARSGAALGHGWETLQTTDKRGRPLTLRFRGPTIAETQQALQSGQSLSVQVQASRVARTIGRASLIIEVTSGVDPQTGVETPTLRSRIEAVQVEEQERRSGVGSLLLARAEALARQVEVHEHAGILPDDTAWPFFEQNGYQMRGRQVYKLL
jgi:uncharacterized protein YegL/GNAT superfamily N-acetyltransferase